MGQRTRNIELVLEEMKRIFEEVPYGVEHTLKVLAFAEEIMLGENVSHEMREQIAIAAILHDIGALEYI